MPASAHGRSYDKYTGPGEVMMDTIYCKVIEAPDGHVYVWWKGTGEDSRNVVEQWEEDGVLGAGGRSPTIDRDLNYVLNRWGYESENVSHDGYSRGGALARLCGGRGYGTANFAAYPPRDGSEKVRSEYSQTGMIGKLSSYVHNALVDPVSQALVDLENATGLHATPYTYTPTQSGRSSLAIASPPPRLGKRARAGPMLELPDPKRLKGGEDPIVSGDFAGLVSTFIDPPTGLIIGYKGIPRKRRLRNTSLERWSPFWAEQQPVMAS